MASQAAVGAQSALGGGYHPPDIHTRPIGRADPASARTRLVDRIGLAISLFPPRTWALIDLTLLVGGTALGFRFFVVDWIPPYSHLPLWQAWLILTTVFFFTSLIYGLYERDTVLSRSRLLTRMMLTMVTTVVITYAVVLGVMYTPLSRRVIALSLGVVALGGGSARLTACWATHRVRRNLLIVGPSLLSSSLVRALKEGFLSQYRLVGCAADNADDGADSVTIPRLGSTADLPDLCRRYGIDDIVVGAEAAMDAKVMERVLPSLRHGCRVTNEATFFEKATGQILIDEITPHWFLFADLEVHCQRRQALKRAFDFVVAALTFLAVLPLLPLIALLIKLENGGPVMYFQERVGQNGQVFRLFKFRTMKVGAETDAPVWAVRGDPRVTRVGRLLRQSHLDELPQLYNVLRGQMSLVGPRPERPDFVVKLGGAIPFYNERHLVKPGMTGWAQIGFRYGSSIEDAKRKLQFDLYYLKHMSIELDIMILLRTIGVLLRGAC